MTQYAVGSIKPNPFRHISRYPIRRDKVAALRESLRTTGFWGNIVARLNNGKPEIAYGHHRLVALKEEYGPKRKVELIIRNLSDEAMLQMMARENMEEWGTSAVVEHETIRAVVEAYAEGKVDLAAPKTKIKADLRYAPSFVLGSGERPVSHRPYTAETIGTFIGWVEPLSGRATAKVKDSLSALEFMEQGLLRESDFEGLTTMQAHAVVEEARKAREQRQRTARIHAREAKAAEEAAKKAEKRRVEAEKQRERQEVAAKKAADADKKRRAKDAAAELAKEAEAARKAKEQAARRQQAAERKQQSFQREGREQAAKVGKAVSKSLRSGQKGYKEASEVAAKVDTKREEKPPRNINDFATRVCSVLLRLLDPDRDSLAGRLAVLIQYRDSLTDRTRTEVATTLMGLSTRAANYAVQIDPTVAARRAKALPAKMRRR